MKHYYKFSDGFFTYYICVETGEKKFELNKNDILVDREFDDFKRI